MGIEVVDLIGFGLSCCNIVKDIALEVFVLFDFELKSKSGT